MSEPTLSACRRDGALSRAAQCMADAESIEGFTDRDVSSPAIPDLDIVGQRALAESYRSEAARLLVRTSCKS